MIKPLLLFACLLPAVPALAQSAAASPAAVHGKSMTLDHFVARQMDRIIAADTDGDGRVSKAELAALAGRGGHDRSRMFDKADTNHDGYLDKNELQAMLTRRFHHLDRNGDGILSPDERMAHRSRTAGSPGSPTPRP